MDKMPDEIWAWMGFQDNGSWDKKPCPCDSHPSVPYLRADVAVLPHIDGLEDVLLMPNEEREYEHWSLIYQAATEYLKRMEKK